MSSDHLEEPGETPEPGTPAHRAEASGWSIRLVAIMILAAILIVLVFIALALYGGNRNEKAQATEQTLGDFAAQVQAACKSNPVDARKVFGDACGKAQEIDERPVGQKGDPGAKGDPGSQGSPGVQGPPPTAAQVAAAVSAYCTGGRCAGRGPTATQVASAVATYCNARGECQGPKGKAAPPITEAQLSAAVGAFCGEDAGNCRGPRGEIGPSGRGVKSITKSGETVTVTYTDDTTITFTIPDGMVGPVGPQGRGIADTDCVEDDTGSHWEITYTDGTTDTARGPCRAVATLPSVASR